MSRSTGVACLWMSCGKWSPIGIIAWGSFFLLLVGFIALPKDYETFVRLHTATLAFQGASVTARVRGEYPATEAQAENPALAWHLARQSEAHALPPPWPHASDARSRRREQRQRELQALKVTALVFYGRRRYMRILHEYLQHNLIKSGGILHRVIFMVGPASMPPALEDQDWLEALVSKHSDVYSIDQPLGEWYSTHYANVEPNALYIKLDDDLVFIEDGAFEAMVEEKLQGNYLFVSGNVVNHWRLIKAHGDAGVLLPFRPVKNVSHVLCDDFASGEPLALNVTACAEKGKVGRRCSGNECRWELNPDARDFLDGTDCPQRQGYEEPTADFVWHWTCGLIEHLSFFQHFWTGNLAAYHHKAPYSFDREKDSGWNINAFVFNSSDIPKYIPTAMDESYFTSVLEPETGRYSGAVGNAVISHLAYGPQRAHLEVLTNVMDEYQRIAEHLTGKPLLPLDMQLQPGATRPMRRIIYPAPPPPSAESVLGPPLPPPVA